MRSGDRPGDGGERAIGAAVPAEALAGDLDHMADPVPFADQPAAGLQAGAALALAGSGLAKEDRLRRPRQAAQAAGPGLGREEPPHQRLAKALRDPGGEDGGPGRDERGAVDGFDLGGGHASASGPAASR